MRKPVVNPDVLLSPVADGYVAYDPKSDQLHRLNPIAALIVELCDGRRTVQEIRQIATPLLPAGFENGFENGAENEVENEVDRWIEESAAVGLLTFDSDRQQSAADRHLSAEELAVLAERSREAGKVQTAYICQRRAVELAPENAAMLNDLGELAHIVGQRDVAREAYQRYLEIAPDDAEVSHLLVSLRDEEPPNRVPNECIEQLYQRFSSFYDSNMCDELNYEGPDQLFATIKEAIRARSELSVLDLGCGTGLAGHRIKPHAAQLIGVDLSPEMIKIARQQEIYDRLEVAEVTEWLGRNSEQFDLIMACDTFIYFGDLRQVIEPALRRLKPGGVIAFSVERTEHSPFRLTDSGRYVHHQDHIAEVAREFGLQCNCREAFLRMEYGTEVTGLFVAITVAQ